MSPVIRAAAAALLFGFFVPLTPHEQRIIENWLVCIDCPGALDSVLAVANRNREAAVDTLARALLRGPPPAQLIRADRELRLSYVRDSIFRLRHGMDRLLMSRDSFVRRQIGTYVIGYRSRGAFALGWLHDPRSVQWLDRALQLQLPPEVRSAVLYARDSLPPP